MKECRLEDHEKYMNEALALAQEALAEGEFPVGCVLVDESGTVVAGGRRRNSRSETLNELDHAEIVTLRFLLRDRPRLDCGRITVYSTMEPCLMCFTTLLLSGIRRFVWAYEDPMGGGTSLNLQALAPLYAAMKPQLVSGVLREKSLRLFQEFFRNYSYWQGSYLEHYTLQQS